jgi:thioredoxin:protein disulfide reductase
MAMNKSNLMRSIIYLLAALWLCSSAWAQLADPFRVSAELGGDDSGRVLEVALQFDEGLYLYADKLSVTAAPPAQLVPLDMPAPKTKYDKFMEQDIEVYDEAFVLKYALDPKGAGIVKVELGYQGCGEEICYPPARKSFEFELEAGASGGEAEAAAQEADKAQADIGLESFRETGKRSGFLAAPDFIAFLDAVESGAEAQSDESPFDGKGLLAIIFIVLIGGAALNLTPCVLPMIPINIAILGAGAQAKSKTRGLLLGATYGAGIAFAYGALGLVVILTGARFGALNSSPWFNFAIAALFIALALSMFGVFNIDFSRFQKGGLNPAKGGKFATAFVLGLVAALLAGACVAPVVISVLLYSTTLYADGSGAALMLPFLLGLGMALPWPFAGAGLSFLPKSGAWMEKVKYVFGTIILIAALYYARLGYSLLQPADAADASAAVEQSGAESAKAAWLTSIEDAVAQARKEDKPILIDFWAEWCKSCLKMDKTTFKEPGVLARMENYVLLKIDGDRKDAGTVYAMDRFVDVGLPTYVIVEE